MSCHLKYALLFLAIVGALSFSDAQARVPLEVAIGAFDETNTFKSNGYGVLVKYDERCLVVTLAHIVSADDELAMVEVVARAGDLSGSISFIDGDSDRDIYVGAVNANSNLATLCNHAEDIALLKDAYVARLRNMLESDFDNLALHATPSLIKMSPATTRAFRDAKERGPIRYQLAVCKQARGVECISPNKGFSGSMVSMSIGDDRLWLGLHQRKCDSSCRGGAEGWQAVSVMQIYEFLVSPNSPFNAESARMKGPAIDTPFPVDN